MNSALSPRPLSAVFRPPPQLFAPIAESLGHSPLSIRRGGECFALGIGGREHVTFTDTWPEIFDAIWRARLMRMGFFDLGHARVSRRLAAWTGPIGNHVVIRSISEQSRWV